MTLLGKNTETLLTGLSSFWQTMFADKDQLKSLYRGTEELLGQAYLDLMTEVLNTNLDEMPLFNKEYWHLLTVREDNVRYNPEYDAPYYVELDEPLVEAEFLYNRIYDPSWMWERGNDFEVDDDNHVIRFYENPFEDTLPGVASRNTRIEPRELRTGHHGVYSVNNPDTLEVKGIVKRGDEGEVFGSDLFRDKSASFTEEDVGRVLNLDSGDVYTIDSILDSVTVRLDSTVLESAESIRWDLTDPTVFYSHNIGEEIRVTNPSTEEETSHYIDSVGSEGMSVVLKPEISFPVSGSDKEVYWTHYSKSDVEELSFWVPDAYFDRESLYLSFGYLINRKEPTSEKYRALIRGIFQFFMMGPALRRIEAALNVMVGVPVVQENGEVVKEIYTDKLVTDTHEYEVPEGSIRSDVQIGDELSAFESITDIFEVVDAYRDPQWYRGKRIPDGILYGEESTDNNVDPDIYDTVIGAGKPWSIGDPRVRIGADFDGSVVQEARGLDGVIDGSEPLLWSYGTKFMDYHEGKSITVEGVRTDILSVEGMDSKARLDFDEETIDYLREKSTTFDPVVVVDSESNVFEFSSVSFDPNDDVGSFVEIKDPGIKINGWWEVTSVLSTHKVRLDPVELYDADEEEVEFNEGPGFGGKKALRWSIERRPPVRHNLGYNVMRDYLKNHMFFVSYDLDKYDIPHLRPRKDIQNVLLEGQPSHVYMMLAPENVIEDTVTVGQHSYTIGVNPQEKISEKNSALSVGGNWSIGGYYTYTSPDVAWVDGVRDHQENTIVPVKGTGNADSLVLTLDSTEAGYVTFYLYTQNSDNEFVYSGVSEDIGEGSGSNLSVVSVEDDFKDVALRVEKTGIESESVFFLQYGLTTDQPSVVSFTPYTEELSGTITGSGMLKVDSFTFNDFDEYRVITLEDGQYVDSYYITDVVNETEVQLSHVKTGSSDTSHLSSGVTCSLGVHRKLANKAFIGGSNTNVTENRGSLLSWPIQATVSPQ